MPETVTLNMVYPSGDSEGLLASPVAPNQYRLEESSLLEQIAYGDVIEVEPDPSGTVHFRRVVSKSPLKTTTCFLTPAQISAPGLSGILQRVRDLGGNWEQALGGYLIVHLPADSPFDIEAALQALLAKS